jgi:murein DD-endopeptidase MepM/ murein hydrolase activator NlpD
VYAERGAEVLAVEDGYATKSESKLGGLGVAITTRDGTIYYYAHLDGLAGGFPRSVRAGETIGYLGSTGNAAGGPPHLHFEVRPQGGEQVDPFPIVDPLSAVIPAPLVAEPRASKAPTKKRVESEEVAGVMLLLGLYLLTKGRRRRA